MMIRLIPLCIAIVFSTVQVHSVRLRRQADMENVDAAAANKTTVPSSLPFPSDEPCPIRCIINQTQAWTQVVGFQPPNPSLLGAKILGKKDTFSLMCTIYGNYGNCMKACVASNDEHLPPFVATPDHSEVCSDNTNDFVELTPCLVNNTKMYQDVCKDETEEAMALAGQLANRKFTGEYMNEYCKSANTQLFCLLPLIRQTCGDNPYDLIRQIANASLAGIRVLIGNEVIRVKYPECGTYLDTVSDGIALNIASTVTTMEMTTSHNVSTANNETSSMMNTTTTMDIDNSTTTTAPVRRDDAGVDDDQSLGRFGGTGAPKQSTSTLATTTNAARRKYVNLIALITFTFVVFAIL